MADPTGRVQPPLGNGSPLVLLIGTQLCQGQN